jgi:hypothetical protein
MSSNKITALLVCLTMTFPLLAGVASNKAQYQGGTISTLKVGTEENLDIRDHALVFANKKTDLATIPYKDIKSIEYGQKAGRRIGAAIGFTILAGPIGLLALASKKRKHFLSLTWETEGNKQAAVFELGKDNVRSVLSSLEVKSGLQTEYESEDAKKNIGK